MIGLDTNVLVRFLVQDDPHQAAQATRLIETLSAEQPGYLAEVVLVELAWVLSAAYGYSRGQIADVLERLLRSRELVIEHPSRSLQAVRLYRDSGADFADALIALAAKEAGCSRVMSFDRRACKAVGMAVLR